MKLQHKLTEQVIDVPQDHAEGVLLPQGRWVRYEGKPDPVITPVEKVLPTKTVKKKAGRPRKVK